MPFKTISPPKKQTDLNAEVAAAAYLANPGLVVMLTTEPVRLGVTPLSGSGGKVTNVSLSSGAAGVALLSRDVAVVRGSDDSVWALLDITHTPKMDQVARDARSLAMCPAGQRALVLGWDETATELTLGTNEVNARQFQLRGTHRAFDLTETECFALVDGADGGQLRVHPGATPEPGAALRCSLPNDAAKLDRVRAGARLAVVYKPGSQSVCVVTGGPNRLSAKMVQLDNKPTDLAVFETSFVATFADGRAALYDSEAIAKAGDAGPIEAKHIISIGGRGEPRAIQATSKGGAVLWIGTSAGEVLSASVVKKSAV